VRLNFGGMEVVLYINTDGVGHTVVRRKRFSTKTAKLKAR
jgi:hypothetical protein